MIEPANGSETAILALAMANGHIAHEIIEGLSEKHFTGFRREVYSAIAKIVALGGQPDLHAVVDAVGTQNVVAVSDIHSAIATVSQADHHKRQLIDRATRVAILNIAEIAREKAGDMSESSDAVVASIEKLLTEIYIGGSASYIDGPQLALELTSQLEANYRNHGISDDVQDSGFYDLDGILRGINNQELIIIGARPSIGKTALMVSWIVNGIKAGRNQGIITAEMSRKQIGRRMVAQLSGTDSQLFNSGGGKHLSALMHGVMQIGESKICVEDSPNIGLVDLMRNARLMRRKDKIEILFVDYLSLITHPDRRLSREERIGDISRNLKQLARELDIPVVALSQVGRESEGHEPTLADLRYSGAIEQDADVIMFLHRDRDSVTKETDIIVAKRRDGATGRAKLGFVPERAQFVNLDQMAYKH